MADYFADLLTSHAAGNADTSDFVLRVDDNRIAYVDVEGCTVWLLTVTEAKLEAAS
jgi:hypothetical protein